MKFIKTLTVVVDEDVWTEFRKFVFGKYGKWGMGGKKRVDFSFSLSEIWRSQILT
jgi:hypothetical protein